MNKPRELPTESLSLHEEAEMVPEMPADQYKEFLADVKKRGVLEPIELIPGTRTIIEGRTRWRAAKDAGLASVPVTDANLNADTPVMYMLRKALLRRHLKPGQRAAMAAKIKKQLGKEARERQREGGRKGGQARAANSRGEGKVPASSPERSAKRSSDRESESRELAAKIAGTNSRYVSDAERVEEKAPDLFKKLEAGEVTVPTAVKMVKAREAAVKPLTGPDRPAIPAGAVTLDTALIDLLSGNDVSKAGAALESWNPGVPTVEKLLTRCPSAKPGMSYTSQLYSYLRDIPGLGSPAAHQIGDALVDAGFVHMDGPRRTPTPAQEPKPNGKKPATTTDICATLHELNPCPFCGSKDVALVSLGIYVHCRSCMACGPSPKDPTPNESRAAWNKRAKK